MDKIALITGASRGIGKQTAKKFAEKGFNVVINYLNSQQQALDLEREINEFGKAIIFKANIANYSEVKAMITHIQNVWGGIDVLINNAGISQQKLLTDITDEDFDNIIGVNVKGVFNLCKAVIPYMINKKLGKIINVSSIWGLTGSSCEVIYSATKAAIIGFTKALAKELGPSNINVNCVAPGIVDTKMNNDIDKKFLEKLIRETPLERIGTTNDIANTILFLASSQSDFLTGQVISPNGGFLI